MVRYTGQKYGKCEKRRWKDYKNGTKFIMPNEAWTDGGEKKMEGLLVHLKMVPGL